MIDENHNEWRSYKETQLLSKENHNSPLQALFKYNIYLQNVAYQNPYILPTKSI